MENINKYKKILSKCVESLKYEDEMFLQKLDAIKEISDFPYQVIIDKELVEWARGCCLNVECCHDSGTSWWVAEIGDEDAN